MNESTLSYSLIDYPPVLFIIFVFKNESLRLLKHIYSILIIAFLIAGCKSTKFVPKDRYLLKKNKIEIIGKHIEKSEISSIIKQQPNKKLIGIKWNLFLFNRFDSTSISQKRDRRNIENRFENIQRKDRENKINFNRLQEARSKKKDYYKKKTIQLKDTLEPNMFLREWLKYKVGEKPVVFDSVLYSKSIDQLNAFLKKKGFYYGEVSGKIRYKRNRKVKVKYRIEPKNRYAIDSVYSECTNEIIKSIYNDFIKNKDNSLINQPLDSDFLDQYRTKLSRFIKEDGVYGYSPSYIVFDLDTNKKDMTATLGLIFKEKVIHSDFNHDSLIVLKHHKVFIDDIYFHILDTNLFRGNFSDSVSKLGFSLTGKYLPLIDTVYFNQIKKRHSEELASNRTAYFLYNGELFLNPNIMEMQSFLEKGDEIKESNIENTYFRMQQSGLFQTVKYEVVEVPESDKVQIHYYLTPSKKQTFGTQTRITNTNGFFGLSAGMNYTNKNLFKGAEKLTLSINSSLQAQPPIIETNINTSDLKAVTNKFYQFEIGPSLRLELPGLFLVTPSKTNKSRLAKTIFDLAYSFQKRDLYTFENIQMNNTWKYEIRNTQTVQMGIPFVSVIKFANIKKSNQFEDYLQQKNNPFLSNTFSDQFVWQDWKVSFEYRDKNKRNRKLNSSFYYLGTFDLAGNMLSLFKKHQEADTSGQYKGLYRVNGLVYSQFSKIDNTIIYSYPIDKKKSFNFRTLLGMGVTYGNSQTSMPYSYSFFAGGANDVRGWSASSLGPGSYKYYNDVNGTKIQVGDIRLATSFEYRFQYTKKWKGALFVDAGNIWTVRADNNRPGSKFSGDWYKELAIAPGLGFRRDFDFFIVRVDIGFPVHNPGLPSGERWFFQGHSQYHKDIVSTENFINEKYLPSNVDYNHTSEDIRMKIDTERAKLDYTPFFPNISFGIGYPF